MNYDGKKVDRRKEKRIKTRKTDHWKEKGKNT